MEVSGQVYAPAVVPREIILAPINYEAGWAPGPVWMFGEEKNPLHLPKFEPQIVQPIA